MPIEFPRADQKRTYGHYVGSPSTQQLSRYFHLDDADLQRINPRRGAHNKLRFALQLTTGTFLSEPTDVPSNVVSPVRARATYELQALCQRYPQRFDIFGCNWLEAPEWLEDSAPTADSSKWLDGRRYRMAIFANTRTCYLSTAPSRALGLGDPPGTQLSTRNACELERYLNHRSLSPAPKEDRSLLKRAISLALLSAALLTAALSVAVSASPTNGEICSVTTTTGAIRASAYQYPVVRVTQAATDEAAAWCTNQTHVPGWFGASKFYDNFYGQVTVCAIHLPYSNIATIVYADPSAYYGVLADAEQGCRDIMPAHLQDAIVWYPG